MERFSKSIIRGMGENVSERITSGKKKWKNLFKNSSLLGEQ